MDCEAEKPLSNHLKDVERKMKPTPEYRNEHKIILQHLMVNRSVPCSRLEVLLRDSAQDDCETLDEALIKINKVVDKFGHKIICAVCEVSGENMCCFICTTSPFPNENVKDCCIFSSAVQSEYFFRIVEKLIFSESGSVGSIELLNLSSKLTNHISKSLAEDYLELFIEEKYLFKHEGLYSLAPLAICELNVFFQVTFGETLLSCKICNNLVFVNIKCSNCKTPFHKHCFRKIHGLSEECTACRSG